MTFLIDLDDTIVKAEKIKCGECGAIHYKNHAPITEEIEKVNALYDRGETIILFTGRNWNHYRMTKIMLESMKVKYHELIMGKPQGIYFDKTECAKDLNEYLNKNPCLNL